jgi:hypothetical protein
VFSVLCGVIAKKIIQLSFILPDFLAAPENFLYDILLKTKGLAG